MRASQFPSIAVSAFIFSCSYLHALGAPENSGLVAVPDPVITGATTYIPDPLEVPDFTPPAPPVEKKVPAMRVDSSLTVPTKGSRTLTVIRGEASTLPDLPIPIKSEVAAQRAPTPEEINQTRIERRRELHLGASIFEHRISLVHWQNPDTGELYLALCGFDLGLLEGLGGFVHQSESYDLMLMVSKGETSDDRTESGFSEVPADSIKILQGDPKNPVGVAPIFVIRDVINAEKSRLAPYQAARERYQQAATAWADAHPVVPRSQTFWLRPHRGSRYLANPRHEATAR